jgi:hypothetical protein
MWDKVKSSSSKMRKNSFTRRHIMEGNGIEGKTLQRGKSPNNFKVQVSNLKEILSRRGLL